MSGQWPPDWEDPDGDVGADDKQADARLSEVTAYLAAAPHPVLPDAVEARISAAIAAEAANRTAAPAGGGRTLGPPPRRPKVRRRRRFTVRAVSSAAVCLVIAGFGYLLTQAGGSSSSSSAASAASAEAAPAAGTTTAHASVVPSAFRAAGEPLPAAAEPSARASASAATPFSVTSRGDVYQKSSLISEVREQLQAGSNASFGSSSGNAAPTAVLIGCVLHITDNTVPKLVDEASYAGQPVYVIATSSRAWVVGRGCTATDSELITSVSLAGLRGNLSALGSVEG